MQREDKSQPRRLETPDRGESRQRRDDDRTRSRRSRTRCDSIRSFNERERLRVVERDLARERDRLHNLQNDLIMERSRRLRSVSKNNDFERHDSHISGRDTSTGRNVRSRSRALDQGVDDRPKRRRILEQGQRSFSPSFSTKDVTNILKSLKDLQSQPSTSAPVAPINSSSYKNILPDFDPTSKNQRIDMWLKKVNECATVYGWDDKTTIHYAMQKLQGLAKTWYESLPSILFNWNEWQDRLINAFPYEYNYGQALEDMLKRKSKFDEPIEVYYYEKLALLNQCDIEGKRAVDCIIHGLTDKTIKSSATTLRCLQPEQLLRFLMSNKELNQPFERTYNNSRSGVNTDVISVNNNNRLTNKNNLIQNNNIYCYNCKEKGHPFLKCPKPIIKCGKCDRMGHKTENCFAVINANERPCS
ncbi:unnamed protein product [Parnassius mnemosyne]|uniref:CCHC-type domain-containing protein n=1 Tax=Parnassius mnemosyne TaxID=213953 RepID=A0AAV1KAN8_9NEOP